MKVWIVLLSLLTSICVWHWGPHRRRNGAPGLRGRARQVMQSIAAGVAVYFSIMSIAALYLMLSQA